MKCIVKIFVLSVFVVRIFGSQYEVTVHGLDEKYKSEEWNCLYKHDLTKKYYYIQFEKKPEYSQIKQNSKIECSKPFALGFVHWVPDSSLYIKFMNNRLKTERSIPLSSYGVQLLYDQFQKDEKYWFLQFELKNNKVHSIEHCMLPKCVPENQLNNNNRMIDNSKTINDYWARIKQVAFLFDEDVENVPKIRFFTNAVTKTELEATIYNKWDTIDNKLNLQITMHCLYNQKESAFELSAAAVEKCCELINDILEYQHNESKPKSLYFSINGILYIFEIDKHQISLIKKYYKDKKVDLSKVGIPTKVSVKPTESDNLKPGIPAVLCLEIPKDYQIEGSNCALNKQNGNHIIIVGSGKSDIFVLLTLQDEKEILPLSEPFYLLVNNGFYLINKVDNKILESIKPSNNEEVKQTTNNPIPENDQEILKPIESNFLKLNNFKNLAIFGAGGISCMIIISILLYFYKK